MKVLQICQKPPLPAIDGGCLASEQLSLNLLKCQVDLKILTMATKKHPFQPALIDKDFMVNTKIEAHNIDTTIGMANIVLNAIGKSSIQEKRFYHSSFSQKLHDILQDVDYNLVIFDGLMTCFYLDKVRLSSKAKLIYRSHNVENNIFRQLAVNESNLIKKSFLLLQSKRLKKVEELKWKQFDQIWSVSSFDSVEINKIRKEEEGVITLPFSIMKEVNNNSPQKNSLFHLGAMDWQPNIDGILWFIKEVWPEVVHKQPSAILHLGGKSIDNVKNKLLGENIMIHNEVRDAREFYDKYEIMIVPIKAGSGIRIKIIQALARNKVIVATKRAVMGIPAVHNEHMIVCNGAEEMSKDLIQLMENEELKKTLSKNAGKLFDNNFNSEKVSIQLQAILESNK